MNFVHGPATHSAWIYCVELLVSTPKKTALFLQRPIIPCKCRHSAMSWRPEIPIPCAAGEPSYLSTHGARHFVANPRDPPGLKGKIGPFHLSLKLSADQ